MADNTTFQSATIASPPAALVVAGDDIGGVLYQRVKIVLGADGAADNDIDAGQQLSAASVPVVLASDHSDIKITLDGEAVTISGTVQVQSNSANIATETTAAAIRTAVELIDNAIAGNEMQVDIVGGGPLGATTDAEATGDGSAIAILKRLRTLLGGTLTVSGTVTANLSAVDNAVLDAIAAAQLPDGHNVTVDNASLAITVAALPLPSGAATAANQSTIIGHVDGIETVLGTIDADTSTLAAVDYATQTTLAAINAKLVTGTDIGDVTINNSTGGAAVNIQDGGNSITVDNDGTFVVQSTLQAGSATVGAVNVKPTTSGGLTIFRSIDVDESEEEVKATAGQVFGWYLFNGAAAVRYVKFYNATAANVTVGSTTPVLTVPLPAGAAANVEFTNGIAFSTAICIAATTGIADNDTGAPSANDVVANVFYA